MNHVSKATTLAQQQRDLLHAIFTTNSIAIQAINTPPRGINGTFNQGFDRGLLTYRANAAASALRSLQAAYPVLAQLIGEAAFEHLAHDFWAQHPPTRGDLAQWGGDLTVFIASIIGLQTEPYLSDVAKAEWALHVAAIRADKDADLATFGLLAEHDPDALTLQLAPATALIHSNYPVASIITAHLYATPSFEIVGQKLQHHTAETALIWRRGLQPCITLCAAAEALFVTCLLDGKSLLAALEMQSSPADEAFDFQDWLQTAVAQGLVLGAKLLH